MEKLTGLNKIKTAVIISGKGSNLKNLIKFSKIKKSPISINLIISNTGKAKGLNFANEFKIKTQKIFKWLKKNNIEDKEMLKTFNCGVGFCLIINPKNLNKINKFFTREFKPYVIGKITSGNIKVKLNGKIDWS